MLEQWVIDKLNPLKAEQHIILADPQRMIRAGARAVDGWARDNGANSPRTQRRKAMTKVLRGIVRGKTIEVTEDLGMPDGQAVDLLVTPSGSLEPPSQGSGPHASAKKLPGPPPGWMPGGISSAAGLLAEEWTDEDDRILEAIQRDRKGGR